LLLRELCFLEMNRVVQGYRDVHRHELRELKIKFVKSSRVFAPNIECSEPLVGCRQWQTANRFRRIGSKSLRKGKASVMLEITDYHGFLVCPDPTSNGAFDGDLCHRFTQETFACFQHIQTHHVM